MNIESTVNHAINTTIVRMWAVDGQLHILSIWDKYNCQGREGMGEIQQLTERVNRPIRHTRLQHEMRFLAMYNTMLTCSQ